jgi:hypothetical protein
MFPDIFAEVTLLLVIGVVCCARYYSIRNSGISHFPLQ